LVTRTGYKQEKYHHRKLAGLCSHTSDSQ
jgi:hypothetical protein